MMVERISSTITVQDIDEIRIIHQRRPLPKWQHPTPGGSPATWKVTRHRFRAPLKTNRRLKYSSELPTQLRSTACRYPGLPLSHQRLLPAHQARLLAIEE